MRDKTRTIEEAAKRVRDASKQIARCLFGGPLITHAIIVSKESQSDVNRDMAYNLRDSLREYLILLLTIERNEVSE